MGSTSERLPSRAAGGSDPLDSPSGLSFRGTQLTALVGDQQTPSFPEARALCAPCAARAVGLHVQGAAE
jgi:hypothetical protein